MIEGSFSFDEIKSIVIDRFSTGYPYLDKIYGYSEINGEKKYGLPRGKISLWAGSPGIGKTRVSIDVAHTLNKEGHTVLTFQNEVTPSEFKGWVKKDIANKKNYIVSTYSSIEKQIETILKYKPTVVICDSVNMINGFENPRKVREILELYKKVAQEIGCHVIFIGHLNKENNVKGNNDLEYLIDINCKLRPHVGEDGNSSLSGVFLLEIEKNRYGKSGGWVCFKHVQDGIQYLIGSEDPRVKEFSNA